jgi:hypothetical protein
LDTLELSVLIAFSLLITIGVTTPLWAKWENATPTPKSGDLESFGTPENLEDDLRGQISLPWHVLYINGKL